MEGMKKQAILDSLESRLLQLILVKDSNKGYVDPHSHNDEWVETNLMRQCR